MQILRVVRERVVGAVGNMGVSEIRVFDLAYSLLSSCDSGASRHTCTSGTVPGAASVLPYSGAWRAGVLLLSFQTPSA
jgi:hypothetical protein